MEDIPNWQAEDDKERCWRNIETDTLIAILYNDDMEAFEVTGENSRLYVTETMDEARKKAREYMFRHPSPSPMV